MSIWPRRSAVSAHAIFVLFVCISVGDCAEVGDVAELVQLQLRDSQLPPTKSYLTTDPWEKLMRLTSADFQRMQGREPVEDETHSGSLVAGSQKESADTPPVQLTVEGIGRLGTVTASMEWWTDDPPLSLQPLPQCCEWYSQNKRGYPCRKNSNSSRYVGPGSGKTPSDFLEALRGKRVVLIGDSQTRAWFESMACYTNADWDGFEGTKQREYGFKQRAKIKAFNDLDISGMFPEPPFDGGVANFCYGAGQLHFPELNLEILSYNTNCYTVPRQRIMKDLIDFHTRSAEDKADVIVPSLGAWYNDCKNPGVIDQGFCSSEKTPSALYADLDDLMGYCTESNAPCLFRETQATHWVTSMTEATVQSAIFEDSHGRRDHMCFPPAANMGEPDTGGVGLPTLDKRGNWRNDVYRKLIQEKHPNIRLMEVWEKTLGNFKSHFYDCTHSSGETENYEPLHLALAEEVQKFNHPVEPS